MNVYQLVRTIGRIVTTTIALAVPVSLFVAIDSGSHSASDTLRPWLIEVAAIELAAGLLWIAIERFLPDRPRAD